ncbi:hypothetical protein DQ04_00111060 [Trypanosoma grayi]|uniref:hypothetical protein n=1 Tax=Trypanosoma grayi TaxID=71804 RepID=UPI0004F4BC34|nr:hypothetical protein DQ04_00111060 [Trypanosoma grayi]KEG15306.1 hypothetical protein DQ04_00111060 [Trypanosoma grayi]
MQCHSSSESTKGEPDVVYLLQCVKNAVRRDYKSYHAFEVACVDVVTLWAAAGNDDTALNHDARRELVSVWPTFLTGSAVYVAKGSPLSSSRPLLEAIVASADATTGEDMSVSAANTSCVEEVVRLLVSHVRQRTATLSSLIPPLDVLQQVIGIIEIIQEYHLVSGDDAATSAAKKLGEVYNALVERYIALFVEEVAFPSYWNVSRQSSSLCVLINGVHPAIYFCFTTLVNLVQGWKRRMYMTDDRPCRQIVARVWERGAAAITLLAEENELSDTRKKQIQSDALHFVLFARMFRSFVGEYFFCSVSAALVRLLEAVVKCVHGGRATVMSPHGLAAFEKEIWNVPPIEASEWTPCVANAAAATTTSCSGSSGSSSNGAFTPWSSEFIRQTHVKAAQIPPDGWEHFPFRLLI